ncbi:MAG: hypothetical protein LBL07_19790 [Tannerella sp.]|nr:hypothetical protein [Tannerella sp.]
MNNIFNSKVRVFGLMMVLASVISAGIFMQSCSSDSLDSSINEFDDPNIAAINSIESQDPQIVLESVFQIIKETKGDYSISIAVCEDLVTAFKATQAVKGAVDLKQTVRLKGVNPETVALGWTYLGNVSNIINATKLYNKYKDEWSYSCLELRLETQDDGSVDVYAKQCE